MCGRYQLSLTGRTLATFLDAHLGAGAVSAAPTWNAAPTQQLPVLTLAPSGVRVLELASWGLVPVWARRPGAAFTRPLINARAETVASKPAFRSAVRSGRVLVPATGFYEWQGEAGSKVPHAIRVRGRAVDLETGEVLERDALPGEPTVPFLMAGIAEVWTSPDNVPELTFSVLTTTPNDVCSPIHDRMPAILEGDDARAWLETPQEATDLLLELLRPLPAERMEAWAVDTLVNDARSDGPELARPALTPADRTATAGPDTPVEPTTLF